MNKFFENLDKQKKDRILNAAIAEFAHKKYEDASTNNIVIAAQIGKGMLFRYFGNKKNLYLYLYRYVREVMDKEIYSQITGVEMGDLPDILKQLGIRKLEVLRRHPDMTDFIAQCAHETSPEVWQEVDAFRKERSIKLKEDYLFAHLNMSLLKPEYRNERTVKLIRWALDGCMEQLRDNYKGQNIQGTDIEERMKDFDEYVEIIRQAFYC